MDEAFRARASTATRLNAIDPSTPAGLGSAYALGASECLRAAKQLDAPMSDLTGEYIITFHAVELGLKAFLVKQGMNAETLRKRPYGHDLVRLFDEAVKHGLELGTPDADKMIRWINEWHCEGVKIRYEFVDQRTLPMCATIFPLIEAILAASQIA